MMTDEELEARVRRTLRAVADATPVDHRDAQPAYAAARAGRRRPVLALAAALVVLLGAVGLVLRAADDDEVTVSSPSGTTAPDVAPVRPSPSDRPGLSDGPIFTAEGDASEVFHEYRQTRLPDVSTEVMTADGVAAGRWSFEDDSGQVASGTVHLAYLSEQWAVVEAETDGVAVDDLRVEGGTLRATISTTNVNSFVVEVLDLDGSRLRGSERIGPTEGPLDLDVTIGDQPVVLRVQLIGGTMLSITELMVDPLAPDRGEAVGEGTWAGGSWRSMRSDDCVWLEQNGVHGAVSCDVDPAADGYAGFGPVARSGEETLYFGVVGSEITAVRVLVGAQEITADTAVGPDGSRLVAVSIPGTSAATVALVADDGTIRTRLDLQLGGPLGG